MTPAALTLAIALFAADPTPAGKDDFAIEVVDEQTGRGVPLVELKTVNAIRLFTDSNGIAAFREPGLEGESVYFHVQSHGYEFPRDGFGYRGKALVVRAGGSATLKVRRLNVAERLYRVTGAGIYRDSLLVGRPVPLSHPVLDGKVLGSDSVVNAVYRGKIHWFWGDTNKPGYPLGNFHVPGATSRLPADGGLDPERGVDLDYFVADDGFARPTAQMPGSGPTWIDGLVVIRDPSDPSRERMFAGYVKIRNMLEVYERGLVEFNDERKRFEKVATFDLKSPLHPGGHPLLKVVDGVEYVYFARPYALVRVKADPESLANPERYEAYTCLAAGSRLDERRIDRDEAGVPRYGWKANTAAVFPTDQAKLVKSGLLKQEHALLPLRDVDTGKPVVAHGGSISWNEHRKRWVMITVEFGGTSFLGEVWYAEADTPLGPWVYARKVVTHEKYSFYNPKQHPMLDKDGGRTIFFEGTYTHTFSGFNDATPRYDYNQVMYKLDLSDPRLNLPVAIYRRGSGLVAGLARDQPAQSTGPAAFFALERPGTATVPVFASPGAGGMTLVAGTPPAGAGPGPLFHALAADAGDAPATTAPLHEFVGPDGESRVYSTDESWPEPGYRRSPRPVCRVWTNPLRVDLSRE